MTSFRVRTGTFLVAVLVAAAFLSGAPPSPAAEDPPPVAFVWSTVVNNGDPVPGDSRKFNSYNQPSLNVDRLVVFRARSKGGQGGEPAHGVFTRDMVPGTSVDPVFTRNTLVPQPNNLDTKFVEPPSFPRIDMRSDTIASRGNHPPVWEYSVGVDPETGEPITTRAGTTGIYTNPFGALIAGTSNLGAVPDFGFFAVPGTNPAVKFDVFPGAPAVTDIATVVFKGNYTVSGAGKTGVYYRELTNASIPLLDGGSLSPAGGTERVVLIANTDTLIPGTTTTFGSTAPPSAAGRQAVFAGFDNEENPTKGGLYLAPLDGPQPALTTLVAIGDAVPGEKKGARFNRLGEGVSFDGRFVAFWGAWGPEARPLTLQCRNEGNKDRVEFCKGQYPDGFETTVPLHQGIFVHDTKTGQTQAVAKTPGDFADFVYWNFSGLVPGTGEGDDAGEPARWRSATFVAVSGLVDGELTDATFHAAFKARTGEVVGGAYVNPVDGIYLRKGPGASPITTVVKSGTDGTVIDPEAVYQDEETGPSALPVTEMGLERDGFRGNTLAINVSMGTEEAGWAGIYLTEVPEELE
jgi:hypothetical protein